MISVLVCGTLVNKPISRVSRNGNTSFVTCQIKAAAGDETFLVSIACFDEQTSTALLALNRGDDLSVAGPGRPSSWTAKTGEPALGLSLVAKQVMTTYAVKQKRTAHQGDKARYGLPAQSPLLDREGDVPF